MFKAFKEFAFKGNLIDMAVGIIIGGAFGTVVKSLVGNMFMPALGKITGGINFTEMYVNLNFPAEKVPYAAALEAGEPVIGYGQFISDFIAFIILALAVFILVKKVIASMKKDEEAPEPEPELPKLSKEEELLTEIRDLLSKQPG